MTRYSRPRHVFAKPSLVSEGTPDAKQCSWSCNGMVCAQKFANVWTFDKTLNRIPKELLLVIRS